MHWAAMPPWLSLSGATTPWSQVEGVEGSLAQPPKLQTSQYPNRGWPLVLLEFTVTTSEWLACWSSCDSL